ncbi:MAG: DNA mismatch repair protein MutS [Thermaceae bacterium]|nr:DNA mismatch repair protein MutS [Thermaceae bacterium]
MKVCLLYPDRNLDLQQPLPPQAEMLIEDLGLGVLFGTMAGEDPLLLEVAQKVVLASLPEPSAILYRQAVLQDCLSHPALIREIYALAVEALLNEKKSWFLFRDSPSSILRRALEVLQMFVEALKKLRKLADRHATEFNSEGFRRLFAMLQEELSDEYFATVEEHLRELHFPRGQLMSAQLGQGNKGIRYILRRPHDAQQSWWQRFRAPKTRSYSFSIDPRDEGGARALSELQDRGLNSVASALAQSTDHITSFWTSLRNELAFYVGSLNLHQRLEQIGAPRCFPQPAPLDQKRHAFKELYEPTLALTLQKPVVGNTLSADDKDLVIITGANRGGKSTFLRSIGLAQLMMQSGLFVAAEEFVATPCVALFTHFKREEDASMRSGKFDEELKRMSQLVEHLHTGSLVLFNESFSATNEREGSEVARQIVRALLERGVRVFFVSHQYDFSHGFYQQHLPDALFLRAERSEDGQRSFRLMESEPLQTSYGPDLYRKIFQGQSTGGDGGVSQA